jgi:F0F1-type ATP synthase assembly protein I
MYEGGGARVRGNGAGRAQRGLALARRAGALLRREGVRVVGTIVLLGVALELLGALAGFGTPLFLGAESVAIAVLLLLFTRAQ